MSDIRSLTEMLRLRNCSDADIKRAIKELKEYDITLLSKQRLEIAYLYYEILKQIQNLYFDKNEKIPEEMTNDVRLLFENIQGICSEATMRERQETAFSVILFLAYLRGHNCNGVQREHNKKLNNGLPILHKVPPKRDYGRYFCIMAEKGGTSHGGLTEKLSPFFHAKKQEVNAYGR